MSSSGKELHPLVKWCTLLVLGGLLIAFTHGKPQPPISENPKEVATMATETMAQHSGVDLPEAYQPDYNGVLRLYNMFPRNYADIDAMTEDLERIRNMGFSHVWLNPLHQPTTVEKKDWPQGTPNGLKGSIYSMRDPYAINADFSVVKENRDQLTPEEIFEQDKAALQRFTSKARELGMVPMFDLVLSHIAPDSPIVDGIHPRFSQVDTTQWVARYANGEPKRHGLDQDGNILPGIQYPDKEVWDDVVMLQYDDPEIRQSIINTLWKPFVEMYFNLGFMGIRVDSVANNDAAVMDEVLTHFTLLHEEVHGVKPTILGESLGGTMEQQAKINPHATHLYNSAYWVPNLTGPNMSADGKGAKELWQDPNSWFLQEMGEKQALIFNDVKTGKPIANREGGTIGYAGSHDELPWILHFPKDKKALPPEEADAMLFREAKVDFDIRVKDAERALREKMAVAALASDAGWFVTSFDERMDTTLRSVFDKQEKGEQLGNLEPFVQDLNEILVSMPATRQGSWSKRFFYDAQPDLVIIERHTGYGYDGPDHLILVSMSPEGAISLSAEDIKALETLTGRKAADFYDTSPERTIWHGEGVIIPEKSSGIVAPAATFVERIRNHLSALTSTGRGV